VIDLRKYFSVGYVLKPQGIKGEIKVEPLTDEVNRFDDFGQVFVEDGKDYCAIKIIGRRYSKNFVFLKLQGYDDINQAEKLRNHYLWIPREMARSLPEDTYYIADIIGCTVKTHEGGSLGDIVDVLQTGSNDVYVIRGCRGEEILIPALKKVVLEVNLPEKVIVVNVDELEGLLPNEN
jgi:16S rRNA processing protein RimM